MSMPPNHYPKAALALRVILPAAVIASRPKMHGLRSKNTAAVRRAIRPAVVFAWRAGRHDWLSSNRDRVPQGGLPAGIIVWVNLDFILLTPTLSAREGVRYLYIPLFYHVVYKSLNINI